MHGIIYEGGLCPITLNKLAMDAHMLSMQKRLTGKKELVLPVIILENLRKQCSRATSRQ